VSGRFTRNSRVRHRALNRCARARSRARALFCLSHSPGRRGFRVERWRQVSDRAANRGRSVDDLFHIREQCIRAIRSLVTCPPTFPLAFLPDSPPIEHASARIYLFFFGPTLRLYVFRICVTRKEIYIYIYIYTYTSVCTCTHVHIHTLHMLDDIIPRRGTKVARFYDQMEARSTGL